MFNEIFNQVMFFVFILGAAAAGVAAGAVVIGAFNFISSFVSSARENIRA